MKTIYQGRKVFSQNETNYYAACDGQSTYIISELVNGAAYLHGLNNDSDYQVKSVGEAPTGHSAINQLNTIARGTNDIGVVISLLTSGPASCFKSDGPIAADPMPLKSDEI